MDGSSPHKVLIAGGGVAALEALLALRQVGGRGIEIELLAPDPEFTYKPLAVAEPFGLGEPRIWPLSEIAADAGATYRREALMAVDAESHAIQTASEAHLAYDALLIAIGARPIDALPGALTYRGLADNEAIRQVLEGLEQGELKRVVFAVPPMVRWALPLYELALLTAGHLSAAAVHDAKLSVVTHEPEPMGAFGRRASESIQELLAESAIELHVSSAPSSVHEGELSLANGGKLAADRVIALPRFEVPPISGVSQGHDGFIGTDSYMRVENCPRVYAAGDATWFPIKQGGLATQQADVAATIIASCFDSAVEPRPFRPTLRAALLTGGAPRYLRATVGDRSHSSAASAASLWWPPSKIAGRYLAPYLARREESGGQSIPLTDLEPLHGEDPSEVEADHREVLELALSSADADARWRDYHAALRWLEIAEQLNLTLPPPYADKRRRWSEAAKSARR